MKLSLLKTMLFLLFSFQAAAKVSSYKPQIIDLRCVLNQQERMARIQNIKEQEIFIQLQIKGEKAKLKKHIKAAKEMGFYHRIGHRLMSVSLAVLAFPLGGLTVTSDLFAPAMLVPLSASLGIATTANLDRSHKDQDIKKYDFNLFKSPSLLAYLVDENCNRDCNPLHPKINELLSRNAKEFRSGLEKHKREANYIFEYFTSDYEEEFSKYRIPYTNQRIALYYLQLNHLKVMRNQLSLDYSHCSHCS